MSLHQRSATSGDWNKGIHGILAEIAQDQSEALATLELLIKYKVMEILRGYIDDPDEADSLFSQILWKIWENIRSYRGQTDANAWNWIARISKNMAFDYLRVLKNRRDDEWQETDLEPIPGKDDSSGDTPPPMDTFASKGPSVEASVEHEQAFKELYISLTEQERLVFKMKFMGKSRSEIAIHLQITTARVSQIIMAIRTKANRFGF
jgi:RNA polymerase sigma factor (sigma-70 family)